MILLSAITPRLRIGVAGCCLVLVACSDDPTEPPSEHDPVVAAISVAAGDSLGLYAGESLALQAVAVDSMGAAITGAEIEWTIADPAVVSADDDGVLHANAPGVTTATAAVDTISATIHVRVTDFVEISAEQDPICARDVEGQVFCIGTEHLGQVNWPHPLYEVWTQISGDLVFSSLSSGYQHTCGLAGGEAYCWGSNEDGRLGASVMSSSEPLLVSGQPDFVSIDAGWTHNCGLDASGNAYCWGRGEDGELGHGEFTGSNPPVLVEAEQTWRAIDAGWRSTCAIGDDGITYCWGVVADRSVTPVAIDGVPENLELISTDVMSCGAIGVAIYCWGPPDTGQPTPSSITMPDDVVDLILGTRAVCALLASGDIYCWGSNEDSLLGDPGLTSSPTPVRIDVGGRKFVALTGEVGLACALAADGGVYCWGHGYMIDRPVPAADEPTRLPAPMP